MLGKQSLFNIGDRVEYFGQSGFEKDWGSKGTIVKVNFIRFGETNYSVQFDKDSALNNNGKKGFFDSFMGVFLRRIELTYDPNQMVDDEDDL